MNDPLGIILRLVADGQITADEAAPLIDALQGSTARSGSAGDTTADNTRSRSTSGGGQDLPSAVRIEITEGGRRVVNLRVPLGLGRMALDHVPGLSTDTITRIREALEQGMTGSLLVVDEGDAGDGVRIVLE
jgi:hypothetical protein